MVARIVSRVALWIGVVAALAIPFVPPVYRWLYPPRQPVVESRSLWDVLSAMLNTLNSISDGIVVLLWIAGLVITAAVAALVAFVEAWRAQESRNRKILCALPIVLAVMMWVALLLTF